MNDSDRNVLVEDSEESLDDRIQRLGLRGVAVGRDRAIDRHVLRGVREGRVQQIPVRNELPEAFVVVIDLRKIHVQNDVGEGRESAHTKNLFEILVHVVPIREIDGGLQIPTDVVASTLERVDHESLFGQREALVILRERSPLRFEIVSKIRHETHQRIGRFRYRCERLRLLRKCRIGTQYLCEGGLQHHSDRDFLRVILRTLKHFRSAALRVAH